MSIDGRQEVHTYIMTRGGMYVYIYMGKVCISVNKRCCRYNKWRGYISTVLTRLLCPSIDTVLHNTLYTIGYCTTSRPLLEFVTGGFASGMYTCVHMHVRQSPSKTYTPCNVGGELPQELITDVGCITHRNNHLLSSIVGVSVMLAPIARLSCR